jgi:hypothetical protein
MCLLDIYIQIIITRDPKQWLLGDEWGERTLKIRIPNSLHLVLYAREVVLYGHKTSYCENRFRLYMLQAKLPGGPSRPTAKEREVPPKVAALLLHLSRVPLLISLHIHNLYGRPFSAIRRTLTSRGKKTNAPIRSHPPQMGSL